MTHVDPSVSPELGTDHAASPTARVAAFVSGLQWTVVPPDARQRAHVVVADTLGVMLAGRATTSAQLVARAAAPEWTAGSSSLMDRAGLALAHATAASALDYDDGHVEGGGIHPSAAIVAALLAESVDRDGLAGIDFLAAFVAGYEVAVRAGAALYPRNTTDRYFCAGTASAIGAAAAAARLLGGDPTTTRRAIELGSAFAPLSGFQPNMVKESIGWAGATGVTAAGLARAGFNGAAWPAAPPRSFGDVTVFDEPYAQSSEFVRSLGGRFEILTGYLKPYACCRLAHAPVDALLHLMHSRSLGLDDIEHVVVASTRPGSELANPRPTSLEQAQYSIVWVLGAVLVHGAAGAAQVRESALMDPEVLAAADRVTLVHDPALDPWYPASYPARVTVRTRDGREFSEERIQARGEPGCPFSEVEVKAKFVENVSPVLGVAGAEALWEVCLRLDQSSVSDLLNALAVGVA